MLNRVLLHHASKSFYSAGSPTVDGSRPSKVSRINAAPASEYSSASVCGFRRATHSIPAATPPRIPAGASSKTRQCSGGISMSSAARRKISGAGFPRLTSVAVTITENWLKKGSRLWRFDLRSSFDDDVAMDLKQGRVLDRAFCWTDTRWGTYKRNIALAQSLD